MKTKMFILTLFISIISSNAFCILPPITSALTTQATNVTFTVHVNGADCEAFQYCVINIVLYRQSTMAEIDSQPFKYGEDEYIFYFDEIDDGYTICATYEIVGQCSPSLTITPNCMSGTPNSNGNYSLYPTYTCD